VRNPSGDSPHCGESPEGLRTCERRQEAAQLYNEEQEGAE